MKQIHFRIMCVRWRRRSRKQKVKFEVMVLSIGDCYKCGEQVLEGTQWDISMKLGFTCDKCLKAKRESHKSYEDNAKWLKQYSRTVSKQLN